MHDTGKVGRRTGSPAAPPPAAPPSNRVPALIVTTLVVIAATLFVLTLRRPHPTTFTPTPAARPYGAAGDPSRVFTVDASDERTWHFFSFRSGMLLDRPGPAEWDLAFRRYHIIANGGAGFAGRGGIADLGRVPFDSVRTVPADGYVPTQARSDSTNDAIGHWYRYGFTSHLLTPAGHTYAVRTADGRYARLAVLGYYCPGPEPGCLTIRFVYQPDGSRDVTGADAAAGQSMVDPPANTTRSAP